MKGREKLVASLPEGVSVAPRLLLSAMEDDDSLLLPKPQEPKE